MAKQKKPTRRKIDKAGKLALARRHLERVQQAWDDPLDWDDLSLYGFYCLPSKPRRFISGSRRPTYTRKRLMLR